MAAVRPVIAIDGPAGSGKSTLARRVALALDLPYVNTGLMYRALTLLSIRRGIDPGDEGALVDVASEMRFDLDGSLRPPELLIDDAAPEPGLSDLEVESRVSEVSRHPGVRRIMRAEQRRLGEAGAVMEGRDIGSVVFPDAAFRILLQAGATERAARRAAEREGLELPLVSRDLAARDAQDALNVPPIEADLVIDTTPLEADEVFHVAMGAISDALEPASEQDP